MSPSTLHLLFQCRSATRRAFSCMLSNWSGIRNYYDVLGIKQDATMEEIKQAFFTKSKKLHPDSDPTNPDLHSEFVQLNMAYQVLSKESSRRLYDSQHTWSAAGSRPWHGPFHYPNWEPRPHTRSWEPNQNTRYWQQFHAPPPTASDQQQKKREEFNRQLFSFCMFLILYGLILHYITFRMLADMHTNFMDEKDKIITNIYNESKEQARVNGFEKQREILRQKHEEFAERYRIWHGTEK